MITKKITNIKKMKMFITPVNTNASVKLDISSGGFTNAQKIIAMCSPCKGVSGTHCCNVDLNTITTQSITIYSNFSGNASVLVCETE